MWAAGFDSDPVTLLAAFVRLQTGFAQGGLNIFRLIFDNAAKDG
jgi:hypothetical protein